MELEVDELGCLEAPVAVTVSVQQLTQAWFQVPRSLSIVVAEASSNADAITRLLAKPHQLPRLRTRLRCVEHVDVRVAGKHALEHAALLLGVFPSLTSLHIGVPDCPGDETAAARAAALLVDALCAPERLTSISMSWSHHLPIPLAELLLPRATALRQLALYTPWHDARNLQVLQLLADQATAVAPDLVALTIDGAGRASVDVLAALLASRASCLQAMMLSTSRLQLTPVMRALSLCQCLRRLILEAVVPDEDEESLSLLFHRAFVQTPLLQQLGLVCVGVTIVCAVMQQSQLSQLCQLQQLQIRDSPVTSRHVCELAGAIQAGAQALQVIDLGSGWYSGCSIDDVCVSALASSIPLLTRLRILNVHVHNQSSRSESLLARSLGHCPLLQAAPVLRSAPGIKDFVVQALPRLLHLRQLSLCLDMRDDSAFGLLPDLLPRLSDLESLTIDVNCDNGDVSLKQCELVRGISAGSVSRKPRLQSLTLRHKSPARGQSSAALFMLSGLIHGLSLLEKPADAPLLLNQLVMHATCAAPVHVLHEFLLLLHHRVLQLSRLELVLRDLVLPAIARSVRFRILAASSSVTTIIESLQRSAGSNVPPFSLPSLFEAAASVALDHGALQDKAIPCDLRWDALMSRLERCIRCNLCTFAVRGVRHVKPQVYDCACTIPTECLLCCVCFHTHNQI